MKTNKDVKKVKIAFLLFSIILVSFIVYSYQLIKQIYVNQTDVFVYQIQQMINMDIPEELLKTSFKLEIPGIVYIMIILLVGIYMYLYYHITNYHRVYSKDVNRIIEQMEHDEFIPSSLEGELALLEDKIFVYKKKNIQLMENNEKEKKQLSDYLENLAHQIKTPIASIRLNEEMSEVSNDLSLLKQNKPLFNRLEILFDNFMKLARLQNETIHIELEEGSVKALFDEVSDDVASIVKDVKLEMEPCDLSFYYDLDWLSEAIYNIIKNDVEEGVSEIKMKAYYNHELLHIVISDNGKGIDEVDLPFIFNRFYRSQKNKKKGIGIGLSLCKEIVEKHHGFITAYNDQGAVFDLAFPYLDIKEKVI